MCRSIPSWFGMQYRYQQLGGGDNRPPHAGSSAEECSSEDTGRCRGYFRHLDCTDEERRKRRSR
jgi:hypothetical protein